MKRVGFLGILGLVALSALMAMPAMADKNKLPKPMPSPPGPAVATGPLIPPAVQDVQPNLYLPIFRGDGLFDAVTTIWGYTASPPPSAPGGCTCPQECGMPGGC